MHLPTSEACRSWNIIFPSIFINFLQKTEEKIVYAGSKWLRALTVLSEDHSLVPGTQVRLPVTLAAEDPMMLTSGFHRYLRAHT